MLTACARFAAAGMKVRHVNSHSRGRLELAG